MRSRPGPRAVVGLVAHGDRGMAEDAGALWYVVAKRMGLAYDPEGDSVKKSIHDISDNCCCNDKR